MSGEEASRKRTLLKQHIEHKLESDQISFTSNADGLFVLDLEGRFIYANKPCELITGYSPNQLTEKNFIEIIPPTEKGSSFIHFPSVKNGSIQNFDFTVMHAQGTLVEVNITMFPVETSNEIIGVYGIAKNITSLKRNEEELKRREELYSKMVEFSPDTVMISQNGICQYINETGINFLKAKSKDDIVNRNILDFIHPDYKEQVLRRIERLNKGEAVLPEIEKLICLDGSVVEVEVKAIPTYIHHELVSHVMIRDLSQRKLTEELMIRSEKLSVAGQLAAGIAHEIRNPITSIKGFLQLMERDHTYKQYYFDVIMSEMSRIELILNELLSLAKPKVSDMQEVDLIVLLKQVITLINTDAIMKNIEIQTTYKEDSCIVIGDANQIKQVFINFIKNAIESMSMGGRVSIHVEEIEQMACVCFIDEGEGIPKEVLNRIGEPFFTTKENGTGLGIMVSKQIVENHLGDVNITSGSGGTCVKVAFPLPVYAKD
ncbi:PAS domain S-box protein [Bacillus sp. KH172YL63]|uniref:PAS domain S-box protein n=1 Tax=Bacillus sp. KH172YL63 TaxID=2709784 RepID=UPI0013E4F417|nr:PAS domain S-box protein [Bacillus sp. KH172YL63]BCB03864.1 sporulation kinase A [Bacillus sp. KH172YL63]